jgi:hypothetical protein
VTVVAILGVKIVALALAVAEGTVEFAVQQVWSSALLGEQQNSLDDYIPFAWEDCKIHAKSVSWASSKD